jgi:hypothetical protein
VANPLVFQPGDIIAAQVLLWSGEEDSESHEQVLGVLSNPTSTSVHLMRYITSHIGKRNEKTTSQQCGAGVRWADRHSSNKGYRLVNCEVRVPKDMGGDFIFDGVAVEVRNLPRE